MVLGTFQDERELVWLESEEGGGRESDFGFCYICALKSLESFTGDDKAGLHVKRLTLARGDSDLG